MTYRTFCTILLDSITITPNEENLLKKTSSFPIDSPRDLENQLCAM